MIFTLLFDNIGPSKSVKAEDGACVIANIPVAVESGEIIENDGVNYIKVNNVYSREIINFGHKVMFNTSVNGSVNGDTITGFDIKYVRNPQDNIKDYVQDVVTSYSSDVTDSITDAVGGDKIYMYIKPLGFASDNSNALVDYGYTLIACYSINNLPFPEINFVDNDGYKINGEYASYARLFVNLPGSEIIAGNIRYLVKEDDSQPSDEDWQNASNVPIELTTQGKYYAYIGLIDSEGKVVNNCIRVNSIIIDAIGPNIQSSTLKHFNDRFGWYDVNNNLSTPNIYYLDESELTNSGHALYRYTVKVVDEGEDSSGVDKVYLIINEEDSTKKELQYNDEEYFIDIDKSIAAAEKLQVVAYDKFGNISGIHEITKQVIYVDKALKYSVEVLYDGESVASELAFPKNSVNKPYTININATCGEEIIAKISYNNGEAITLEDVDKNNDLSEGLYRYTFSYQLPNNISTDIRINNVAIKFYKRSDNSEIRNIGSGGFLYDCTAPVVTDVELQRYDTTNNKWIKVSNNNGEDDYWVNMLDDENFDYRYRYSFKVKDPNNSISSGLNEVKLYKDSACTDEEIAYERDGDAYVYEIDKSEITSVGLFLYVKTSDNVGNVNLQDGKGYLLTPVIKATNEDIKLELISVTDNKGNPINIIDHVGYYNAPIKVKLKASSASHISKICINDNEDYLKTFTGTDNNQDDYTKRYYVEWECTIPKAGNQELLDMKARAYDANTNMADVTIGSLFYDATKPVIDIKANTSEWTNSPSIEYKITSGIATSESKITNVSYKIEDSVNDYEKTITSKETKTVSGILKPADIEEASGIKGTKITFYAEDKAGNILEEKNSVRVKYDKSKPAVNSIIVSGVNLSDKEPYLKGNIPVEIAVSDNLSIDSVVVKITDPSGRTYTLTENNYNEEQKDIAKTIKTNLVSYNGDSKLDNGKYIIEVLVKDKATNSSDTIRKTFYIDNKIPVVNLKVSSGVFGGKMPKKNYDGTDYDYYIRSDVGLRFVCEDDNIENISVTDNGNSVKLDWHDSDIVGVKYADYSVIEEGKHVLKINAYDRSDNKAEEKSIEFVKDTGKPIVNATVNGSLNYTNGMDPLRINHNSTVTLSLSDMTKDDDDINVQINKTVPGTSYVNGQYLKTSNTVFSFNEEADYEFNVFVVDKAGNKSDVKTVKLRIDKTAPALSIHGIAGDGTSSDSVKVTFKMQEVFWEDTVADVKIYHKAKDGQDETLLKTINYEPKAFETNHTEDLLSTGVYKMVFSAKDLYGHESKISQTFTIDKDAPVITLKGVNNYDITDKSVDFIAEIKDDFYNSKKISITGTKTNIDGQVTDIVFSDYDQTAAISVINQMFNDDGIYDIQVSCTDIVGNTTTSSVHFTIDKTAPVFGDLSKYDGTVMKSFDWNEDLEKFVSDLTVCDVHMYLNGREYDGVSAVEDGSYTLLITAEDEMGHYTEKSVSFVIDTTKPVFIVTGVEDGEIRNDEYSIEISLQLDDDIMEFVELNGNPIMVQNNEVKINITEKGKYTIIMQAKDAAGNVTNERIRFEYGEESNSVILIIVLAIILVLAIFIIYYVKRRNKRKVA